MSSATTGIGSKTVMTATLLSLSSLPIYGNFPSALDYANGYDDTPYVNVAGYEAGASSISSGLLLQNKFSEQAELSDVSLKSPTNKNSKFYAYKTKIKEAVRQPAPLGDGYLVPEV